MSEAQLWERLSDFDEKKYIMTSTVYGSGDKQGLIPGQAYTTLGIVTHNEKKFVKVRNPMGRSEFNGKWSDTDLNSYAVNFRYRIGHTRRNDGTFYMELHDYKALFNYTIVGMYSDSW
jgi:hypothetical protein